MISYSKSNDLNAIVNQKMIVLQLGYLSELPDSFGDIIRTCFTESKQQLTKESNYFFWFGNDAIANIKLVFDVWNIKT